MFYDAKKRVAKFLLLFYNPLKIPKRRSSALRFLFSSGILCILFVRRLPLLYFSPIYEAVNIVRKERHETNHNRNIRYIFNRRQSPQNYQNDATIKITEQPHSAISPAEKYFTSDLNHFIKSSKKISTHILIFKDLTISI